MQLKHGHTLQTGKYRIEKKIGQGGFGITYRAFWKMKAQGAIGAIDTEIPVVIKEFFWKDYCAREAGTSIVSIGSVTGNEMFTRFKEKLKKEAIILSRLTHPNIVRVLDVFEENNTAYMVMQLVEGESLKDKIERMGKLSETSALKYTQQLCSALTEVHNKKILHLDLKPSNVIIDKNDNAQLIDFGVSKQYNDNKQETSTTPIGISKGYAPIEQYSGIEKFNPPTDVYALGAMLYTMLSGQIPLEATRRGEIDMESVTFFNPDVSKKTENAISKAMSDYSRYRFQTVQNFWQALNCENQDDNDPKADVTIIEDQPQLKQTETKPVETLFDTARKTIPPSKKTIPAKDAKPPSKKRIFPPSKKRIFPLSKKRIFPLSLTEVEKKWLLIGCISVVLSFSAIIYFSGKSSSRKNDTPHTNHQPKAVDLQPAVTPTPDIKNEEAERLKREEEDKKEEERLRKEKEEQNRQKAADLVRQANNTFENISLGNKRYDDSYKLYKSAKELGGDVSGGYRKFLSQADLIFNNGSGLNRFDEAFKLYKYAKDLGGNVSGGYRNFLSMALRLIENGSGYDVNVKKLLQYAQQLNNTKEVSDLLEKCK